MKLKVQDVFLFLILIGLVLTNFEMLPIAVHAQTWVEGHITQNTTWTVADSPYRAINDVIVDSGVLLTVEPGVEVQFADGFSLSVEGSMIAIGSEANPIIFTSSRTSPSPGAWGTIRFIGGETECFTIKHSIITYAVRGITIDTHECTYDCGLTPKEYGKVLIEKNKIHHNSGSGIEVFGDTHSGIIIARNTIWSNLVGIDLRGTGDYDYFYNVTISGNTVSSNDESGIEIYHHASGGVDDVTISGNTVLSNGGSGINLYSDYSDFIYNVTISGNTVLSNGGSGINLFTRWGGDFCNVTISNNIISSNNPNGIYTYLTAEDWAITTMLNIVGNKISANDQKGIFFFKGHIGANLTGNSISYNTYGVFLDYTKNYWAQFNDIYNNTYGMNITGATVNAEYNYWGDATGPYHMSLNPEGEGNSVNGDGTNLDFIPFLISPIGTINQRPVAILEVDNLNPNRHLGETVTFDASASTDDGRIDYYLFDFGDGTNSSWTPLSVVTHEYVADGEYTATVIVMDDVGVTSLDGELVSVQITVIPEFPSWIVLPLAIALMLVAIIYRKRLTE